MKLKIRWLMIPLSPIAIVIGFGVGIFRARDKRIAFYSQGEPVTYGELRRWAATGKWSASTAKGDNFWEPKTKH